MTVARAAAQALTRAAAQALTRAAEAAPTPTSSDDLGTDGHFLGTDGDFLGTDGHGFFLQKRHGRLRQSISHSEIKKLKY